MTEAIALDRRQLGRWRNALIAGFGIGGITVSSWGTRLPAITAELQVTTGTIGTVLAFITVGSIAGLLTSTPIAHRFGTRRGIAAALVVIAVAMAVLGLGIAADAIPLLAVAFAIVGYGIALMDVLLNVEGTAVERAAGRTLLPFMHAAWSIGVAVGSGIGAACAALGIAPAPQFAGEAVVILVAAVLVHRALPDHAPAEETAAPQSPAQAVRAWLRGWLDVRLLLIGVVMLGVELGEGSANNWLTLGVQRDHGQTAAIAALFFTAFAAGEAATRILAGPVIDRVGRVVAVRVTTGVGVIGLVLFILGGSPVLVLLGVLLWAVGVSMGFPLGMSAAAEGGGANPAARVSVVASIGYFANLAAPPAIGLIAEGAGLLQSFWLLVVFMVAAFAAAGALATPRTPSIHSSHERSTP